MRATFSVFIQCNELCFLQSFEGTYCFFLQSECICIIGCCDVVYICIHTYTPTHTHATDIFLPQHPDNIHLDQLNHPKDGGDERTKLITSWEHPKDDHCLKNSRHGNLKSGTHFVIFEILKVLLSIVYINFRLERFLRDKFHSSK
jgi:hypothetical protein